MNLKSSLHLLETNPLLYFRIFLIFVIIFSLFIVVLDGTRGDDISNYAGKMAPSSDSVTVVSSDSFGGGYMVAFWPNGSVMYFDNSSDLFHDVDPVSTGRYTVAVVASELLTKSECHAQTRCIVSRIDLVNLSTGVDETLWRRTVRRSGSGAIHDVDKINNHKWLVADIADDSVYIINVTSGLVEWRWDAEQEYPRKSGGNYPGDWTHLNDVEWLENQRILVSLRNQDQVVFLDVEKGLLPQKTLGKDDNHTILFEQHNPDFIIGNDHNAILVADSENRRIIEYRYDNNSYNRSWIWQDQVLQWPRDADRLPNGNTLITDTHGGRVIEINEEGEIVWQLSLPGPYEAERLGTGPESTGGRPAHELGSVSKTSSRRINENQRKSSPFKDIRSHYLKIIRLLPPYILNGIQLWLPPRFGIITIGMIILDIFVLGILISLQVYVFIK